MEASSGWVNGQDIAWVNSRKNPPSMTMEDLRAEVWEAWETLAHYEASINNEADSVLYLPNGEAHPTYGDLIDRMPKERVSEIVLGQARQAVETTVTEKVNEHCFLAPLSEESNEGQRSKWSWGFRDLRGEMYLQMLWVMERGVNAGKYCKRCNEPVPMTGPKGNKSPARKEFCCNNCRVAYGRGR